MKTCKVKTIELLKEIKEVCDQEGIRCFISGEMALFEKETKEIKDPFNNGSVAVFAGDIEKLTGILNKKADRKIESLANNSRFPGFYVRYMDTSTTLLDFTENVFTYDTNSMGVNIEIICGRKKNGFKGKLLYKLKRLWVAEHTPYYIIKRREKKTFKQKMISAFFGVAQHTSLMGKLFNAWIREGKEKTILCDIATNRGDIIKYKTDIFDNTVKTTWIGEGFETAAKLGKFTENYFQNSKRIKPVRYDIYDFDVPWAQYSAAINRNNISMAKYQDDQQEYLKWHRTEYTPMSKKRDRFYSYMFCAEDRMLFYKEFKDGKREFILELYNNRDFEQLSEILSEYIKKIHYYAKHRIGFCSDAEVFRAAISVIMYDAFNNTEKLPEFKKKCKKLFNIINNTNYRHFDSIENAFWGEREKEEVLKERKKAIRQSVVQEAREYYKQFRIERN